MTRIIPAILTDDLDVLRVQLTQAGEWTDRVHVDIGDGHFIRRRTITIQDVLDLDPPTGVDFHLMVTQPARLLGIACQRPVDAAIAHVENLSPAAVAQLMSESHRLILAVNPTSNLSLLANSKCLRWLVMGVIPGAQGNPYIPETPGRIRRLRKLCPQAQIGVDGGMDRTTIPAAVQAGATEIVVGHAIWQATDPSRAFEDLSYVASKLGAAD